MNTDIIHSLNPESSMPFNDTYTLLNNNDKDEIDDPEYNSARLDRYITDTDLRKHITYSFIFNITLWLSGVLSVLYFNSCFLKLNLSDPVLITLLTTSTLNVIGMMTIILKNLFPIQPEKLKSQAVWF
ncbi:hypothetical protein [Chitinophaga sancti]|uniref:Uncharacterized protein n=1 Tax=Chitinophaga sancti TaxID=1004 RepID=A0A1K1RP35_9BACT|nr:hypothetical protein [Chitinophaga sancti]WQD62557.1 hypothetical protein U0033_32195 [Chitinophaga sancti]WQG91874.1 hypothetical protein SR876_10190 [Chitinophaga sancti]SFW73928.1 hypothetical protein SAMN05661012_04074 [Chitinophaga sancti]